LRGVGQTEEPVVFIGKAGITPAIRVQMEDAIQARELVKCRILPNAPGKPGVLAMELAADSKSELIAVIGRNFLVFRRSKDKPRLELPEV